MLTSFVTEIIEECSRNLTIQHSLISNGGSLARNRFLQISASDSYVVFLYLEGRSTPVFVVKIPASEAGVRAIYNEFNVLTMIRQQIGEVGFFRFPAPLLLSTDMKFAVFSYLAGRPLYSIISKTNFRLILRALAEKSNFYHSKLFEGNVRFSELVSQRISAITPILETAKRGFLVEDLTRRSGDGLVPKSVVHGDYNLSNILITTRDLAVIDWKDSTSDVTFLDPINLYASAYVRGFVSLEAVMEEAVKYIRRHLPRQLSFNVIAYTLIVGLWRDTLKGLPIKPWTCMLDYLLRIRS